MTAFRAAAVLLLGGGTLCALDLRVTQGQQARNTAAGQTQTLAVEVRREGKPVKNARVIFRAPTAAGAPGGFFAKEQMARIEVTGEDGVARAAWFPNNVAGKFTIQVEAAFQKEKALVSIEQSNDFLGAPAVTTPDAGVPAARPGSKAPAEGKPVAPRPAETAIDTPAPPARREQPSVAPGPDERKFAQPEIEIRVVSVKGAGTAPREVVVEVLVGGQPAPRSMVVFEAPPSAGLKFAGRPLADAWTDAKGQAATRVTRSSAGPWEIEVEALVGDRSARTLIRQSD